MCQAAARPLVNQLAVARTLARAAGCAAACVAGVRGRGADRRIVSGGARRRRVAARRAAAQTMATSGVFRHNS